MAVYQVQANGQAPPGLSPGDFVNTAGGMYQIAEPGTYGAKYNPDSGYWSYKLDSDDYKIQSLMNSAQAVANQNTMTSQEFAREQMAFQNTSAEKAMAFSADQAALNREWQERLSNTAHQREVKDLIAAGLNPILSTHGSGATTPSGATAAGVASSGAQGSVDTGGTNAVSQMITTMLNNQTSENIARIQAAATMYAADQGYLGTQFAANMGYEGISLQAMNAALLQEDSQKHDIYMNENYPTKDKLIGQYLAKFGKILTDIFNSPNATSYDKNFVSWLNNAGAISKQNLVGGKAAAYHILFDNKTITPYQALKMYKEYSDSKTHAGLF